ncbi:MAG: LysM peptidoglycan-binding domain-containing protein [Phycisphaerales bacterium]|nr:LysM peptidoglycan-binding domain-containing protein [Phycisphaerales bacterium]
MTREQKLAMIIGFALVLAVGVLVSDHLSGARGARVAQVTPPQSHAESIPVAFGREVIGEPIRPLAEVVPAPPALVPPAPPVADGTTPPVVPDPADSRPGEIVLGLRGGSTLTPPPSPDRTAERTPDRATERTPERLSDRGPAAAKAEGKKYTVKEGDTLWRIASEQYGDGRLAGKLAEFNKDRMGKGGQLRVGGSLLLPSKEALSGKAEATTAPLTPAPGPGREETVRPTGGSGGGNLRDSRDPRSRETRTALKAPEGDGKADAAAGKRGTYTVQRGDSLSQISQRTLGTSRRWQEILELNRDKLSSEDDLAAGMVLKLPAR